MGSPDGCIPFAEAALLADPFFFSRLPASAAPNLDACFMERPAGLFVFSHLRWDFVFQRPQHLLSRMARHQPVIFFEEPVFDSAPAPYLESIQIDEQLLVLRPHTPVDSPGFSESQHPILRRLIREFVTERVSSEREDYVAWFYTPLALPLLSEVPHSLVIYDCMDALDAFLNAPVLLKHREQELLERADLVFTGGPSLYKRLKDRHPHVHCFPSSVDAHHFAQANSAIRMPEPSDQASIGHPRLGYFGVIDERIDLALIDAVAQSRPDWQIVLVGPTVKIDAKTLPRRPNIHYLGQKTYAELPEYLAGWSVCLLPFARNESTRYISPTKTLEYMAAEKPIVSTPITDVAEPYGHIVSIEHEPARFVTACQSALDESPSVRSQRIGLMNQVLALTSWDNTADQMSRLIDSARADRQSEIARRQAESTSAAQSPASSVVVIGAGPTGLSAAYHLGSQAVLVEQNDTVGGWCRSVECEGFTFDYAGHIMFSNDSYVHQLYAMLLGDNVQWQDREAWIYSKNTYTRYPFQAALYGLPPDVIKECILGVIEARYGLLNEAQPPGPIAEPLGNLALSRNGGTRQVPLNDTKSPRNSSVCLEGDVKDCCGDGVMESTARLVDLTRGKGSSPPNGNGRHPTHSQSDASSSTNGKSPPQNFEEFIYKVWGAGIAKHFAIPYNRKLWAVPLSEMETSWLGGRVPMPELSEMLDGALKPVGKPMGPNARFGYPLEGGFQSLMDGFLPHLEGPLLLGKKVIGISCSDHEIALDDGQVIPYEQLISTMPLPVLIRLMGTEVPVGVQQAAASLRHVSVRCVHLGIGREHLTEKHWIYYPEETVFHRIFVQGNASPRCNRSGGFGLTCEITYSPHKPLPCDGEALIQRCIQDCVSVGIIRENDPVWTSLQVDMPYAYVVYDHARPKNVARIREWLRTQGIILAGRYSEWEYYNSDHAFLAGKRAAEEVTARITSQGVTGFPISGDAADADAVNASTKG